MNKLFTISALLGFAALAAGGGLLAGFSSASSGSRVSSPTPVSDSVRPSSGSKIAQPAPLCTGAVPSALRVARFEKAQISSDTTVGSLSEVSVTNSSREIAEVGETESSSGSSLTPSSASRASRRLPTLTSDVNPVALGNSFAHNGQRISVADVSHSPDGEVAGIDLQSAPESAAAQNQRQASDKNPGANRQKSSKSPYQWGLTYEEELFRTKWGWDAFAQAQSLGNHQ